MESNSTNVRIIERQNKFNVAEKLKFGRKYPNFIGHVTSQIFLSTNKTLPSRKEMEVLEKAQSFKHQYQNQTITYYHWFGGGKTILLIHGWNGNTGNFSRIIPSLLTSGYSVIGLDLPGHGFSTGRYSNIVLSAKVILSLVSKIGNPHAIISHSFGGAVASVAQEMGIVAEKLIYICPPLRLEILREEFSKAFELTWLEQETMRMILERKVKKPLSTLDLTRIGSLLSNELLVIHDEDDMEIPVDMGRAVSSAWKNSKLIQTKGLGHRMILRSEEVKNEILNFLKGSTII